METENPYVKLFQLILPEDIAVFFDLVDVRESAVSDRRKLHLYLDEVLLSYLLRVPETFGFKAWSPYLDRDIALAMLGLPDERRRNRQWQADLFRRHGVCLEDMNLRATNSNVLDRIAVRRRPVPPLNEHLLSQLFKREYIRWINRSLSDVSFLSNVRERCMTTRYVKGVLGILGLRDNVLPAYYAYLTIKPIERLMIND
jgi:hypothetical protein